MYLLPTCQAFCVQHNVNFRVFSDLSVGRTLSTTVGKILKGKLKKKALLGLVLVGTAQDDCKGRFLSRFYDQAVLFSVRNSPTVTLRPQHKEETKRNSNGVLSQRLFVINKIRAWLVPSQTSQVCPGRRGVTSQTQLCHVVTGSCQLGSLRQHLGGTGRRGQPAPLCHRRSSVVRVVRGATNTRVTGGK